MKTIFFLLFITLSNTLTGKEFVVGVQDIRYYPLYDFPNASHSKDLLDAFAKSKGYTFKYLSLPILRFDQWYEDASIDFKYPDNKRWFRKKSLQSKLVFSDPTVELIACVITKKDASFRSRNDIKRLGTLLGFHPSLWIDLISSGNTLLIESPSTIDIVKQTLFGAVDAINLEPSVVNHHLKLLGKEGDLLINKAIEHEVYSYHLSTINYPDILDEFNQFMIENVALLEELKETYKLVDVTPYR